MHDRGKIIGGLALFAVMVTFPIWFTVAAGNAGRQPELEKAKGERCVEPVQYMRAWHMDLLDGWRDLVARQGQRYYTSHLFEGDDERFNGTVHYMSLSRPSSTDGPHGAARPGPVINGRTADLRSCLECHENKSKFCDECHGYAGVTPTCFDCHVDPKNPKNEVR